MEVEAQLQHQEQQDPSAATVPLLAPQHVVEIAVAELVEPRAIILFDGVCNICNGFVQFVYPRDPKKRFFYQAQQTVKGRELLMKYGLSLDLSTIYLIDEKEGKAYSKSTAIFQIIEHLIYPWSVLAYLGWVPRPIRDFGYSAFAYVRYYVAGKKETCGMLPGIRDRFVDFRSPIIEDNENKEF